ncbi:MAG: four helix bundle protein [Elusimicrobiota bacterium]|nr:four helix bundle protein [Elusimicrobiota bacterium]
MQSEKPKIDIDKRTYSFALKTVNFVQKLKKDFVCIEIGKQLLRSGTSVAANVEEVQNAFSRNDFIFKMNIALKESSETCLWLRLIKDAKIEVAENILNDLIEESSQLNKIIGRIVKTTRNS